jgi:hypothetical protein
MTDDRASTLAVESAVLRRLLVVVALVAFAASLVGLWARATHGARLTADEPQYLLSATSLWDDGDLDISNQLAQRAYEPYHEITVDEQTVPLDESGRRVSPHDPLLPVLLAVPMRLGGWIAAKLTLAFLGALTAAFTLWVAVRRFDVPARTAALVTCVCAVGVPLAPYGVQVYPEVPAALVVLGVLALATAPHQRGVHLAAGVAGLTALPWLSSKYVPAAAVLGVGMLLARRRAGLAVWPLVASGVVAAITYAWGHQQIFGGWTAYAAGDHFADTGELSVVGTQISPIGRTRRIVGLLVDRTFGIAAWAPVWFALPAALGALARRRPPGAVLLLATLGAGWATATFVALTMHGWWFPGRQIVHVLPLGVVALAWGVDALAASAARLARWAHLTVVALGLWGLSTWVWLAVESSTGRRTLVVDLGETAAPTYRVIAVVLPDGQRAAAGDEVLLAGWAVVLVASAAMAWRCSAQAQGSDAGRSDGPSASASSSAAGTAGLNRKP